MSLLPYFVARSVAHDLDRQGKRPGLLIRVIIGIGTLALAGAIACVVVAIVWAIGWNLGIFP